MFLSLPTLQQQENASTANDAAHRDSVIGNDVADELLGDIARTMSKDLQPVTSFGQPTSGEPAAVETFLLAGTTGSEDHELGSEDAVQDLAIQMHKYRSP